MTTDDDPLATFSLTAKDTIQLPFVHRNTSKQTLSH